MAQSASARTSSAQAQSRLQVHDPSRHRGPRTLLPDAKGGIRMSDSTPSHSPVKLSRGTRSKLKLIAFLLVFAALGYKHAFTQSPALNIEIDQQKLLQGRYPQKYVIEAGGQFWTTPFTQYDATTQTGDGYGEGPNGPRAAQRKIFNPNTANYPYLRLNGLDSQSCYECHNTIGSDPGYGPNTP